MLPRRWRADSPARRTALVIKQATALANGGRCAEAAVLLDAASREVDEAESFELRRRSAEQLLISGRIDEGIAALQPLLASAGIRFPRSPRHALVLSLGGACRILLRGLHFSRREESSAPVDLLRRVDTCFSAAKGLMAVDTLRAGVLSLLALRSALDAGEPSRIAILLATVGAGYVTPVNPILRRAGGRMLRRAKEIARESNDPYLEGATEVAEGYSAATFGRWLAAFEHSERGLDVLRSRCAGVHWECNLARTNLLRSLEEFGRFGDLEQHARQLGSEARDSGDRYGGMLAVDFGASASIAAGDRSAARESVAKALAGWSQSGFHIQHLYALRLEVLCDLCDGRPRDAWSRLEGAWPALRRSLLLVLPIPGVDARLMRARARLALAAEAHDRDSLSGFRSELRALVRSGREDIAAHGLLLQAGAAMVERRGPDPAPVYRRAAETFDRLGLAGYAAVARRRLGALTPGIAGRSILDQADETMRSIGIRHPADWSRAYAPGDFD